ncbi:MAG: hypothetical protein KDC61_24060, partial [Saprospiraceae bacterium]|nr:hypothetical protein [Saprospiraceae bacterium]
QKLSQTVLEGQILLFGRKQQSKPACISKHRMLINSGRVIPVFGKNWRMEGRFLYMRGLTLLFLRLVPVNT